MSTHPCPPRRLGAFLASLALAASAFAAAASSPAAAPATPPAISVAAPLIPRATLFGNPERTSPQISPDGTRLAFLAPRDGVLNLWVVPRGRPFEEARPVTAEKVRPIPQFFWSPDGRHLLFVNDRGGDENYLLYRVDPETAELTTLTPFEKTRVRLVAASYRHPRSLLLGINHRDAAWHDLYRLELDTGALTLLHENKEQLSGYLADDELRVRLATRSRPDGSEEVLRFGENGALTPFLEIPFADSLTTSPHSLPGDGNELLLLDSRARDKTALVSAPLDGAAPRVLAESPLADVGGVLTHPETGAPLAYGVEYLKNEWTALDPALREDFALLDRQLPGQWNITSTTRDNQVWIVRHDAVTAPVTFHLYDRAARRVEKLFTARPALEGATLAPMHPREIAARDGLTLVSYLTLPPGTDPDGDGVPAAPLPLVLNVHGGPWARDSFGYEPEAQWLANRGYAVLQVNFRGSTGFGKAFVNAADREWGRAMHHDLLDAVAWASAQKIARPDQVVIYGGSYGGYATLWGLAGTPEAFAAGVSIVGPSNLETLIASIPPYWATFFENFARRVGDPRTEEGRALLRERSPLTHAAAIRRPLLILQGANDPRVKQAESDQIVAAMREHGIPVTYVLYPDEGHGFARAPNRRSSYAVVEAFLGRVLGGRVEPVGDDIAGASLQVPVGAEHVPGLAESLPAAK